MKKVMIALLAGALSIPVLAFAQQDTQSADKADQQKANQSAEVAENGSSTLPQHSMTGMVSNNGQTFTSDNKSYIVNNPHTLKAYNDQSVMIKFQFNADQNKIHIVSVSPAQ